jgi:hypothetical protein
MSLGQLMQERPWLTPNLRLPHSPAGMLGRAESLLYYYLAKEVFKGSGTIVDAGSFLGRSAYHFAEGLRANPAYIPRRDYIHCFDLFQVTESGTVRFIREELNRTVRIGDSVRDLFDSQVASVAEMLRVHAGDFTTMVWQPQSVEILLVDIAKNAPLCRRVVEVFFPNLTPGESLVIHQDYHHPWLPHIHVTMEYLADYFELVIPRVDDSAVFRYRALIPQDVLRRVVDYGFAPEEQFALMDRAVSRLAERDRFYVQLASVILRREAVDPTILLREVDEIQHRFEECDAGYAINKYPYFDQVRRALAGS